MVYNLNFIPFKIMDTEAYKNAVKEACANYYARLRKKNSPPLPAKIKRGAPTEAAEQAALIKWARLDPRIGPFLIHIPNGGSRDIRTASRLKAMGALGGVSDLFLAVPSPPYAGLWIEMKSAKGSLSPLQKSWIEKMRGNGYAAETARGWEEGRDIILKYL